MHDDLIRMYLLFAGFVALVCGAASCLSSCTGLQIEPAKTHTSYCGPRDYCGQPGRTAEMQQCDRPVMRDYCADTNGHWHWE